MAMFWVEVISVALVMPSSIKKKDILKRLKLIIVLRDQIINTAPNLLFHSPAVIQKVDFMNIQTT